MQVDDENFDWKAVKWLYRFRKHIWISNCFLCNVKLEQNKSKCIKFAPYVELQFCIKTRPTEIFLSNNIILLKMSQRLAAIIGILSCFIKATLLYSFVICDSDKDNRSVQVVLYIIRGKSLLESWVTTYFPYWQPPNLCLIYSKITWVVPHDSREICLKSQICESTEESQKSLKR